MCRLLWWASMAQLHDAYLSVVESLFHAGTANDAVVSIRWVVLKGHRRHAKEALAGCDGIWCPAALATGASRA